MRARTAELPRTLRAAAKARQMLGVRGTRAVYRSAMARPLRRLLSASAPEGAALTEICGGAVRGALMYIDLSCEKYYWLGTHEEAVQRALETQAGAGEVAYDIGAHAGFFTLLLSRVVGEEGRVLAFEPHPANAARLSRNLDANSCTNAQVRVVALSDRTGEARFDAHASSLEGSLLDAAASPNATMVVPTTTIDAVVRDGATPPDLLKIDVEGAEGRVIRGARETITVHRPRMIIEIHSPLAWCEVLDALPIPYVFKDVEESAHDPAALIPGHYLAVPAEGR